MSDKNPGEYPLTESEKAELKRRAREAAAELDQKYPQGLSGGIYDALARAGERLTDPDPARAAGAERDLEKVWAPTDLKVALAIVSGRLTRLAWDAMGPDERGKLFRPQGFSAWERGTS